MDWQVGITSDLFRRFPHQGEENHWSLRANSLPPESTHSTILATIVKIPSDRLMPATLSLTLIQATLFRVRFEIALLELMIFLDVAPLRDFYCNLSRVASRAGPLLWVPE